MRLVQLQHSVEGRRLALVEEPSLRLMQTFPSLFDAANQAIRDARPLQELLTTDLSETKLDYDSIYKGEAEWTLLPAADHPTEPGCCLVSGTGLTHKKSAANRDAMHQSGGAATAAPVTDSMKIYQWGAEGGRPAEGAIGVQPEWFYKGNGTILRAHNEPLEVPDFGDDGGEEPEIAGIYLIGPDGQPYRIGFVTGNEFSDHEMERKNYLYLAPAKLRTCSIGPEIVLDETFANLSGTVRVERGDDTVWSHAINTGEANMVHSLTNLEYHHFKYPLHCRPGDLHVHFFGADAFSYGDGVTLADGDMMEVQWNEMGRPLRNPIQIVATPPALLTVKTL
ncbi:MAG: hypothetical protein JWN14_2844 [Chthonomonadales bacterium]|nr:hypothetical protein [Chthonomonadales bacterium]